MEGVEGQTDRRHETSDTDGDKVTQMETDVTQMESGVTQMETGVTQMERGVTERETVKGQTGRRHKTGDTDGDR